MAYEYMGVTDIANVTQTLIASLVQEQMVERSRLAPTITDYSSLVEMGSKAVNIPRGSDLTAAAKSEGTEIVASHFTYAADSLALNSHQYVAVDVEDIAKMQSKVALIEDLTSRMGNALGDALDTLCYTQMILTSTSPDHQIQYTDTTNEDLEVGDILEIKRLMEVQKLPKEGRVLLISPTQEKNILKIDNFIDASKYGDRSPVFNGEIGQVYGFKVLVHNLMTSPNYTLGYVPSHACYAKQQDIKFEINRNVKNLSDIVIASYLAGCKVLDGGKRGVRIEETA